jgi:hypothetical protein
MIPARSVLVAAAVSLTAPHAATAQQPLAGPPGVSAAKVLVIGTDGTRIDLVDRLAGAGQVPRLTEIARTGFAVPSLLAYEPPAAATLSEVGWATIATGVWPAKHGVNGMFLNNDPRQSTKNGYLDFLSRIEQVRPQLSTFIANNWANLTEHEAGGPIFGDGIDARFYIPAPSTIEGWDQADQVVADASARYLREGSPDAGFVYLGVVDETAHLDGSANPRYLQAIRDTDRRIGELLDAIRARPTYLSERWLVIVTTDHGQQNLTMPSPASHGFGSDLERMSFVAAGGFGVDRPPRFGSIRVVDVAPTVLARLGIAIDPGWKLDGQPFAAATTAPVPVAVLQRVTRDRLRLRVRARAGAPALRRVVILPPAGPRVAPRRVRLRAAEARSARINLRFRGRAPGRLRLAITDAAGTVTKLAARTRGGR